MQIQWFPGHMHRARKQMRALLPQVDLLIEVLDARIPFSSQNPMLRELRGDKPCIELLNKTDLADPRLTEQWHQRLEKEQGISTLAVSAEHPETLRRLPELCRGLFSAKEASGRNIHCMIVGIPNVGKSTLINILVGRVLAKTGNEPAITRGTQRINLGNGVVLSDTPGVLWPNVENPPSGFRLAATGAIRDTAIDYPEVAMFLADYLLHNHPQPLTSRYRLDPLPKSELELLESVGRLRGCLRSGNRVDMDKVSRLLIMEFRNGVLGQISLETPQMIEREMTLLAEIREQKAEQKRLRQSLRSKASD